MKMWINNGRLRRAAGRGRKNPNGYTIEYPWVHFADVAEQEDAKLSLQPVVDFLRSPDSAQDARQVPCRILISGEPGTGKAHLARAVAGETKVPFYYAQAADLFTLDSHAKSTKVDSQAASRVRTLVQQAGQYAPAIIYIDGLDITGQSSGGEPGFSVLESEQALDLVMRELNSLSDPQSVVLMVAANLSNPFQASLIQNGWFHRQVTLGLPDRSTREGILRIHSRSLRLAHDVNLSLIARTTTGLTGSDLVYLCKEAAQVAGRNRRETVNMADFEHALDHCLLHLSSKLLDEHESQVIAYHEAGHALAAWLIPASDPIQKISLLARCSASLLCGLAAGENLATSGKEYLLAKLAVMLAGRAAEELALGEATTGAEDDLLEATHLARKMVTRWGMGSLGLMALSQRDQDDSASQLSTGLDQKGGRPYSEATAARIDQGVQELLNESYEVVRKRLSAARNLLDQLVGSLLQHETIQQDDLLRILGPRLNSLGEEGANAVDIPKFIQS